MSWRELGFTSVVLPGEGFRWRNSRSHSTSMEQLTDMQYLVHIWWAGQKGNMIKEDTSPLYTGYYWMAIKVKRHVSWNERHFVNEIFDSARKHERTSREYLVDSWDERIDELFDPWGAISTISSEPFSCTLFAAHKVHCRVLRQNLWIARCNSSCRDETYQSDWQKSCESRLPN